MKRYIRCFAENKKDLEMQLSAQLDVCIEHMLYLLLFPSSTYIYHWEHEVYSFFSRSPKLKGTNKFPTKQQIISWTIEKREDVITDQKYMEVLIQTCCEEESYSNIYNTELVIEKFDSIFVSYFKWLAEQLSTIGIVSPENTRTKLHDLYDAVDFPSLTTGNSFDSPIKI